MGTWSYVLLGLFFAVVMTTGDSIEKESDEPCLSWRCARKRVLQLSRDENFDENSEAEKPCASWTCRREMLLREKFLNAERAAETAVKRSRSKRRAIPQRPPTEPPQRAQPEPPANEEPCLTKDCRTGKRSLVKRDSADNSPLLDKLRFVPHANERGNLKPGCMAWHCNMGKRR